MRLLVSLITISFFLGCADSSSQKDIPPKSVSILEVKNTEVTSYDSFPGRLESSQLVEIVSTISGYVKDIHFKEGAFVEEGELLFTIDPREVTATKKVRETELNAARTEAVFSEERYERAKRLLKDKAVSMEELESRRRSFEVAQARKRAALQRLRSSKSNLDYAFVKAPFEGRVSEVLVDRGNLANSTTPLTTIASMDPIYVRFQIDERSVLEYRRTVAGFDSLLKGLTPEKPVMLKVGYGDATNQKKFDAILDFLDNALDRSTGTLTARAKISNSDFQLQPNLFVTVNVPVTLSTSAVVVPKSAILSDLTSRTVFTVDKEQTAQSRRIKLGADLGDSYIIEKGLNEGDMVITDNLVMLFPGQKVSPQSHTDM